jgi:arsenate reductase-like glutaredoxin family protein
LQKQREINERDFFKNPFSRAEIENLLQGKPASDMFNFRSPSFTKGGLERDKLSNNDLIEMMLKEPRLIRRPVVRIGAKVYFGADSRFLASIFN